MASHIVEPNLNQETIRLLPPVSKDARREADPVTLFPWLVCELTLELPVASFTVHDLLNLSVGSVIETECHHTRDIPLQVNGEVVGWSGIEVIGTHLAARISELV